MGSTLNRINVKNSNKVSMTMLHEEIFFIQVETGILVSQKSYLNKNSVELFYDAINLFEMTEVIKLLLQPVRFLYIGCRQESF